ncbi:MAG: biopolymer transporter ExbD [Candidatus Goldbacteria bacterium]|nr:biopolymer transporter ExbD [Candidatus Goldiibacteriota bacterium]
MLKKKERETLNSEINVVPLVDVMMVLLIIFMVTTPFIMQGSIKINLPSANATTDELPDKNIIIGVSAAGEFFLNGNRAANESDLVLQLKKMIQETGNTRVIIEGDKSARHGAVVSAMGAAREAGADKLAVSTIPDDNKTQEVQ